MKLIKDGKIFDLSKSTLIATSTPFRNYGIRQRRLYKSVNGVFFETETCNYVCVLSGKIAPEYHHPEERISIILTMEKARDLYELIIRTNYFQAGHYDGSNYEYNIHVKYEDLFELVEG